MNVPDKLRLQQIINGGLIVMVIFMPLTITCGVFPMNDPIHPLIDARFSIADFLIGVIFLLWLVKVVINREYKHIKIPPAPVFVFIGACFLSVVYAVSLKNWLKELIQLSEYFIILYILLLNNLTQLKQTKQMSALLFGLTGFIVLLALYQQLILQGSPYLIRALFENQHVLGIYMALVLPLLFGYALFTRNMMLKILLYAIILAAVLIIQSGEIFLALLVSLGIMSYLNSRKTFIVFVTVVICGAGCFALVMPERQIQSITGSLHLYEQGDINENYYRLQTILYDVKKKILVDQRLGSKRIVISTDLFISSTLPPIKAGNRYVDRIGQRHIKQRYLEWQAALNMLGTYPFFGAGLGNYQQHIGHHYRELPKINTAEPNQDNGYLVIGATAGFLGLTAFIWLLVFCMKKSLSIYRMAKNSLPKAMALGLWGSFIAATIINTFSSIFIAGMLGYFVILIFWLQLLDEQVTIATA